MSTEDPDGQAIGTWANQLLATPTVENPDRQAGLVSSRQFRLPEVLIQGALSASPSLKAPVNKPCQSLPKTLFGVHAQVSFSLGNWSQVV